MKKITGTMALMAIMILCTAVTCTSGDDSGDGYGSDGPLALTGTTWETTNVQMDNQWLSAYESGRNLSVTFNEATYSATLKVSSFDANGVSTSGGTYYLGGGFSVASYDAGKYYIYCYDGNSRTNERIRFEVLSFGSIRMEANVFLAPIGESCRMVLMKK